MRTDVWRTCGASPASRISRPASFASATPCSLSGTSCQPVNRFSRFQVLCPCRSRTSVPGFLAVAIDRGGDLDDLRELVRFQAGAPDQAAVAQRKLNVRLDVGGVDAPAVQDPYLACRPGPDH